MSTTELRERIHEGIENLDNGEILSIIQEIIERELGTRKAGKLTPEQEAALLQSMDDVKNGRVIEGDEADRQTKKWLDSLG